MLIKDSSHRLGWNIPIGYPRLFWGGEKHSTGYNLYLTPVEQEVMVILPNEVAGIDIAPKKF